MVQSELCNLHGLSPKELVKKKEDHNEMGGYFVINGNEKVVRLVFSFNHLRFPTNRYQGYWVSDKKEPQTPL